MSIWQSIKLAWKNLLSNKSRSLLTMLGVIIGVAAVIVMMSVSAGTEHAIADKINQLGSNLIFISPSFTMGGARGGGMGGGGSQPTLVYEDVNAIRDSIKNISGVSVDQTTTQDVDSDFATLSSITVVGTTPDYPAVRGVKVDYGGFFDTTAMDRSAKVAVLGYAIAAELFPDIDPIGESIKVDNVKVTVIGVLEEKGYSSGVDFDNQIYIPITLVFDRFQNMEFARFMGDSVRMIYVAADSPDLIDDVILQISILLAKRHDVTIDSPDFSITTQSDLIETQSSTTETFRTLLGWVAGVSLVVGGIGIMNIMLVSVSERTREIGLRQAIGATPRDVLSQFLIEALMLSLLGGLIGIVSGIGGSYAFAYFSDMPTYIMPSSIVLAFFSSAFIGILFGFIPANKAAKLDPIVALRHF